MKALAWFLVHYAQTVPLAALSVAIGAELDARALAAVKGKASPNLRPPQELPVLLFFVLIVALWLKCLHR